MFEILGGIICGVLAFALVYCSSGGIYTVNQNERVVLTNFGRAERLGRRTSLDTPSAEFLSQEERERYIYPQVKVMGPGGPYIRMPWQRVYKISTAIQTMNVETEGMEPKEGEEATLSAVTKDQLNIGLTGQIRYRISEDNVYAYLFGIKSPTAHIIGYFISVLRERISRYEGPQEPMEHETLQAIPVTRISINDLRKNLSDLNLQMKQECRSSAARYGILLDASLITGIDSPDEIEGALSAINTAHNEVSSHISLAQANADQRIEQSKKAVEIEMNRAQAEVQPIRWMAEQIGALKRIGPNALPAYLRNVRLELFSKAKRVIFKNS
jgi:regulator of protease activity HflC (stomatin/prohibitin superfamily)